MTLGWGGMTSTLVVVFGVSPAGRLTRCEDASTSTNGLASKEEQIPIKAATVSFRDERRRVEWPRRGTPLSKEPRTFLRNDEAVSEAIEAKKERIGKRQASCGECSRHEGSGPADLPGNQEEEQEEEL
jgi:hypothetical protein